MTVHRSGVVRDQIRSVLEGVGLGVLLAVLGVALVKLSTPTFVTTTTATICPAARRESARH